MQHWLPLIRSLLYCLHVGIRGLVFKTLWTSKFVVLIYAIVRILITIVIAFSTLISWVIIIFIFLIIIIYRLVWKLRKLIIKVIELVRSTQFIWKVFLTVANIRSLVWLLTVLLLHSWLRVLLWILSRKIVLLLSRIVIVRFYLSKWLVEWVRIFLILLVKCVDH